MMTNSFPHELSLGDVYFSPILPVLLFAFFGISIHRDGVKQIENITSLCSTTLCIYSNHGTLYGFDRPFLD